MLAKMSPEWKVVRGTRHKQTDVCWRPAEPKWKDEKAWAASKFTSKPKVPKGYAQMRIEFTEEESEAITASMERYAAIANVTAPEGMGMVVPVKVKDAMTAKALAEYVEDLVDQLKDCSTAEAPAVMDKAIKSQLKAYSIHNLPVYIFQAAGMFELIGDLQNAKRFFGLFLRAQDEFKPDRIDTIFVNQTGFDLTRVIALAKEKVL